MPEARASRKRQIQVTPGPFSGAAASSAYLTANRVQADSLSRLFSKVFPAFSTSGLSRAFTEGFAIFSASRDGNTEPRTGPDGVPRPRARWHYPGA